MILSSTAWSQVAGRISGTVTDPTGSVIPGATISLSLPGGETAIASQSSNEGGLFIFSGLQPVTYILSIESAGFSKYLVRGLKVNPGIETALGDDLLSK
ncbi:MAG: carboxypeptidase-like regulatory domain-containing protein [Bryobacterales bacterium]|nr:carboxypeptidase-like regulatory domain-containing protein [Bryobacterales bacterium]